MVIKSYIKLYWKFADIKFDWRWSVLSSLIFNSIIGFFLYLMDKNIVLKLVPFFIFLVHLLVSIIDIQEKKGVSVLFSFLKTFPLSVIKITMLNYLAKIINKDQMLFYAGLILVFLIFKIDFHLMALFAFRTLAFMLLVQTFEYTFILISARYFYQIIVVLILFIVLPIIVEGINQKDHLLILFSHINKAYDSILFLLSFLAWMASILIVNQLLKIKNASTSIFIVILSNILGKFAVILLILNNKIYNLTKILIKIYARDKQILFKLLTIVIYTIVYSSISRYFHNDQGNKLIMNLALITSAYFFYEIKINGMLNTKSQLLEYFPVEYNLKKISMDVCGGIFIFLFGGIALIYEGLLYRIEVDQLCKAILSMLIYYLVSINFNGLEGKTKIKKYMHSFLYGIICLIIYLLIYNLSVGFTFIILFLYYIIIFNIYYIKEKLNKMVNE